MTVTWQPVTKDNLHYLKLASELSLEVSPDKEKMEFWEEVYSKYFKIWDQQQFSTTEAPTRVVEVVDYVKHETSESSTVTTTTETIVETFEQVVVSTEDQLEVQAVAEPEPEPVPELPTVPEPQPEPVPEPELPSVPESQPEPVPAVPTSQNGVEESHMNGLEQRKPRTSNEIKMVQRSNGHPKDVIRANDPPEDDLPKNIGVNKFVNFFESLGGKK